MSLLPTPAQRRRWQLPDSKMHTAVIESGSFAETEER